MLEKLLYSLFQPFRGFNRKKAILTIDKLRVQITDLLELLGRVEYSLGFKQNL